MAICVGLSLCVLSAYLVKSDRSLLANLRLPSIVQSAVAGTRFENDSQNRSSAAIEAKIEQVIQRLTRSPMPRYYVYEDYRFEAKMEPRRRRRGIRIPRIIKKRYESFAEAEEHIIRTLANHSLRTRDVEEADLFFVPISLTRHMITPLQRQNVAEVFYALYNQTIFQSSQGHRHFMIVQTPNMWSWIHVEIYASSALGISQEYPKLWNVTIGKEFDQEGCDEARRKGLLEGHDFKTMMLEKAVTMSRSSFSLNSIPLANFPYSPASLAKFRNSTWDCFYHSRTEPSMFNSTPYRHALLNATVIEALPGSSIGFDIDAHQWMEHFQSSRFCFVIRGDTPMSRSQLRAVKAGCIPVIVSNLLEYYSPTLKRTGIAMSDYCIMLDEDEFLADPVAAVLRLNALGEEVICEKLAYLALAQRLFLPDHPESLFVPALLHEVKESMKRPSNNSIGPGHKFYRDHDYVARTQ
jgi:hypothetical protein